MMFEGGNISDFAISDSNDELMDTMETWMENSYDASLYENSSNKYIINSQSAPYVIGTFTGRWSTDLLTGETSGIDWVVMVVAVHINEDQIVLVRYVTEMDDFDRYLPKAEKVFKSISPV